MGLLATFRPGSYRAKMPKNVEKWRFLAFLTIFSENAGKTRFFGVLGLKRPFSALLGLLAQGFYINPSGALPRGRGSPPRGLGGLGTRVPGDRGGPETSGIPDPGIGVWKPLPPGRGAPGGPGTGPGRPREWGFTSTPRAGAPRSPREGKPPQGARGGSPPPSGGRASGLGRCP